MTPRKRGTTRPAVKLIIGVVMLAAVCAGLGYWAGHAVKSPAQIAADAAAPPLTDVTAGVEDRKVTRSVSFDGRVEREFRTAIPAPTASDGTSRVVVTRVAVKVGDAVQPGNVLAEANGRPIFVLSGPLPSYRSLVPGATGPDVAQLQQALTAAGRAVDGDTAGTYGARTAAAVRGLYTDNGYTPSTIGTPEVTAAEAAATSAQRALEQAQADAPSDAQRAAALKTVQYAKQDLATAQADLALARVRYGAQVTQGEIVFAPALPAQVSAVSATVGGPAGDSLMTLSSGPLVVRGQPSGIDAERVTIGISARLLLAPTGDAEGKIASRRTVTSSSAASGADAGASNAATAATEVTVEPLKPLPDEAATAAARVIAIVETSSSSGLTVPVAAVSGSADGTSTVIVTQDGRHESIAVTTGFTGDGYVQVTARETGKLHVGHTVLVGRATNR